jgi:CheY-like chemotaxis protein
MGKLILLCDDDRAILEVTRTILEGRDMKVVISTNCDRIVERAVEHRPDLILMDVWIPQEGGEQATRTLKKDPRTGHIPVILFSAVNNLDIITLKCGADGYINKPFELEEMVETIERHLGIHKEEPTH